MDNIGDRSVTVSGTAANARAAADSRTVTVTGASLTLTDDEATPTATLALSEPDTAQPDTIDESGAGNSSTVTATLDRASSEAVTLTVAATAGTNAGAGGLHAVEREDAHHRGGTDREHGVVTVTANDNAKDEPDKEVTVSATVSGASGVAAPAAATLTIADDDAAPAATLAVADSAIAEDGGTTTVTATLSHPSSAATTVTVTGVTGFYTAGFGRDHRHRRGQHVECLGRRDDRCRQRRHGQCGRPERHGDGTAANAQAAADSRTVTVTGASLTLTDDEATPTATLALSEPDAAKPDTIDESGAGNSSTVTATLNRVSSEAVTLTVAATAGTNAGAGDFALSEREDADHRGGADREHRVVTVTANDDTVDAPDKSVTVSGHGERRQRGGGPDRRDPDHRGRRRRADGDAGSLASDHRRERDDDAGGGDGDAFASVEPGDDAHGVGGGGGERGGRRLLPLGREDADRCGRRDDQHRNGDGVGERRREGRAGPVGDGDGPATAANGQGIAGNPVAVTPDDPRRRREAHGDAGAVVVVDLGERRQGDGDGGR